MSWVQRLKRVFGIEIDTCARCGRALTIIASIEQPELIARILAHLKHTAAQPHPPERPRGAAGAAGASPSAVNSKGQPIVPAARAAGWGRCAPQCRAPASAALIRGEAAC
jgi:hypothetical protein